MTPPDRTVEPVFARAFYLTFRLFVSPTELSTRLCERYESIAEGSETDRNETVATPVRLRVYNAFKCWLESYWCCEQDVSALPIILRFAQQVLSTKLPQAGIQLEALVAKVSKSSNTIKLHHDSSCWNSNVAALDVRNDFQLLPPIISKSQLAQLMFGHPNDQAHFVGVLDLDDLEITRQLTIAESEMFCLVKLDGLVGQASCKIQHGNITAHVKAMSSFSNDVAAWVTDSILEEPERRRRANVIKHWIKIAEHCVTLNNYSTLMAIMCALNSSTIARLKRTWTGVGKTYSAVLEELRITTDHERNYAAYRASLRRAIPPCVPFLGLCLTDLTFIDEGNPNYRPSKISANKLINFDKHLKTARVISDLQRIQIPYRLQRVPEIQAWIHVCRMNTRKKSATDLWRRSLVLEPKLVLPMRREATINPSSEAEPKKISEIICLGPENRWNTLRTLAQMRFTIF